MHLASIEVPKPFRILSLDGGGAKGFYTLGVLEELEALAGKKLCDIFNLIYGTSTGSIIAGLISLGYNLDEIIHLYRQYVPVIMQKKRAKQKSDALSSLAKDVFKEATFRDTKTSLGVVATNWVSEKPMIFKSHIGQAYGRTSTFVPGFGVTLSEAIQASCSAYPFFLRKKITTSKDKTYELIDGGYCANNPTLYAITDATCALNIEYSNIRVISLGVGVYPEPKKSWYQSNYWINRLPSVQLLQKTLEINTQSMDQLRSLQYRDVPTVRISETFEKPEMATDLFEYNLAKLDTLRQQGNGSFAKFETEINKLIVS